MATMIVKNCKHGTLTVLETTYDYNVGDIVYPFTTRERFPGYNENRHAVVFFSETATKDEVEKMVEKVRIRNSQISG